jgi:hypothetical protein
MAENVNTTFHVYQQQAKSESNPLGLMYITTCILRELMVKSFGKTGYKIPDYEENPQKYPALFIDINLPFKEK